MTVRDWLPIDTVVSPTNDTQDKNRPLNKFHPVQDATIKTPIWNPLSMDVGIDPENLRL